MSWFKVDDGFYDHPKVAALQELSGGPEAIALWVLAGSWCSRYSTQGVTPTSRVTRLGFVTRDAADLLVKVGLWVTHEDGYQFHDWGKYQPCNSSESRKKAVSRASSKRHRDRLRDASPEKASDGHVTRHASRTRAFSRPDPSLIKSSNEDSSDKPLDAALSESGSASADVRRVFEAWVTGFWSGRGQRPKLDDKRRKRIRARLKTFTVDQLCEALGRVDAWYVEQGHTGLETLLRDDAQVEKHLGALKREKPANGSSGPPKPIPEYRDPDKPHEPPRKRVSLQEAMGDWRPS